ncbi:hypothetical protein [Aquimarina agarivorans]|uniref:hypothetical protein n=1 Tax=Aquimarina agarivorans TaxID=980584 RepID=UPI001110744C|nr:hypothetical protein [Aquimarina agarivorans]
MAVNTIYSQSKTTRIPTTPIKVRKLPADFKAPYLNDSDYNYEETISLLDRIKRWFIEKLMEWFNYGGKNALELYETIKIVFYFLVLFGAILLIYKLAKNKEFRWLFGKKTEPSNGIENYESHESVQVANFSQLITEAIANKNYRLAIKYHYLQLLQNLQNGNKLEYDPQKTTHDYQLDLEDTEYHATYAKAAYYYTYIWYGEFKIDDYQYKTAATAFDQLLKQLKNE